MGEKAGTVEHVHDEVKNGLGGGHMPSQHFAVQCKLRLRFCANKEAIARVQKDWEVFTLPTQATAFT